MSGMLNPAERVNASRFAQLCLAVEDTYDEAGDKAILEPKPDARVTSVYTIRTLLIANDAIFHVGPLRVDGPRNWYGYLLQSKLVPTEFVLVVRGTATFAEWVIDAEFAQRSSPWVGAVEDGFYSLYETFRARAPGSKAADAELPVLAHITAIVGDKARLTVCGHSLGAALATYFMTALAAFLPGRVRGRIYASPRPGNDVFCTYAGRAVADCISYINPYDIVPKVPEGFGYSELPSAVQLPVPTKLPTKRSAGCQHHLVTYLSLIDPAFNPASLPRQDAPYLTCFV